MNIVGSFSLPNLLTSGIDSVASKNLEDATKARRAFEVTQREQEKTNQANSAGYSGYGDKTANTLYQAQDIAQQFKDYMDKSPEELLRQEILKELGYTEEQLASMDPKERAKAEQQILDRIKLKIEQAMREKGVDVDLPVTEAGSSI